jgi:Ca2+-binding RTX toxin-like protein
VAINLATGTGAGGTAQGDTLVSIEGVFTGSGNDVLIGSAAANTLFGGGGRDTLAGGAGADRFVYGAVGDSAVGANADRITDFSHAQADHIDLHLIDADSTTAGDQAFHFIGTAAFGHHAGELRFAASGADTAVTGDVNGDGTADFQITLTGHVTPVAGVFVL